MVRKNDVIDFVKPLISNNKCTVSLSSSWSVLNWVFQSFHVRKWTTKGSVVIRAETVTELKQDTFVFCFLKQSKPQKDLGPSWSHSETSLFCLKYFNKWSSRHFCSSCNMDCHIKANSSHFIGKITTIKNLAFPAYYIPVVVVVLYIN